MSVDFRKTIKKKMKQQKINTPEMARRLRLSQQTLYDYLAGKSEMTAKNLEAMLNELGAELK